MTDFSHRNLSKLKFPGIGKARIMDIQVGNIVKLKKQHPCGSHEWEVLRIGADFRIKCTGCGHQIMIPRKTLEKSVKEIKTQG